MLLILRRPKVRIQKLCDVSLKYRLLVLTSVSNRCITGESSRPSLILAFADHLCPNRISQDIGTPHSFFLSTDIAFTQLRFTFNGGSNVTLGGSEDPHCGWVNSHGQRVREVNPSPAIEYSRDSPVVGCDAKPFFAGKPSLRLGFPEYHKWGNKAYETMAGVR